MNKHFYSIYGPSIISFLDLKRSLGFKYRAAEYELGKLDKIALQREEDSVGLTRELVDNVCKRQPNESEKSRRNRIQVVRLFASFLNDTGHASLIPALPSFKSCYSPFIFSTEEIGRLLHVCDQITPAIRNPHTGMFIIPVLIRLLYATGLRVGEAMSLSLHDIGLCEKTLKVRDSKNGKERMIPFSDSMADILRDYLSYRRQRPVLKGIDHLFVLPSGRVPTSGLAYKWFRRILFKAEIPHAGRGGGPRLHDLRHTFAVHSLISMSKNGADLYYSLPILSTYLGHQSLAATDKYVRLTSEMYPSLIMDVNKICPHIFPEFNKNNHYETD